MHNNFDLLEEEYWKIRQIMSRSDLCNLLEEE